MNKKSIKMNKKSICSTCARRVLCNSVDEHNVDCMEYEKTLTPADRFELTLLDRFQRICFQQNPLRVTPYPEFDEDKQIIKTALEKLEKPKKIVGTTTVSEAMKKVMLELCPDVEDQLKAFEIFKRNPVMVACEYQVCIVDKEMTYEEYCDYFPDEEDRNIKSQEEYDLLKRILKDSK